MTKDLFSIFKVENIVTSIFFKKKKKYSFKLLLQEMFSGRGSYCYHLALINETSVE